MIDLCSGLKYGFVGAAEGCEDGVRLFAAFGSSYMFGVCQSKKKGPIKGLFCCCGFYAALAWVWLNERFSALNSALKLAVVMFSSMPTPCTARSPLTRSSM